MKTNRSQHHISGLMALLLFGVFAVCILAVLLGATEVYQRLSHRDADAYAHRTAALYLTTRVHQSDRLDALRVEPFGDGDALVYTEQLEGECFETRIYCWEGHLCELFSLQEFEAYPEDGERLLPLRNLQLQLEDNLLTALLDKPDGTRQRLLLHVRSREVSP